MENWSYVIRLLGPSHHVRWGILQALKLVNEHIRQAKEETAATVQSQCHESVCELLGHVLWQHVSNVANSPDIHVAQPTQRSHVCPSAHGRIKMPPRLRAVSLKVKLVLPTLMVVTST